MNEMSDEEYIKLHTDDMQELDSIRSFLSSLQKQKDELDKQIRLVEHRKEKLTRYHKDPSERFFDEFRKLCDEYNVDYEEDISLTGNVEIHFSNIMYNGDNDCYDIVE